jgi:hypothetical protein
LFDALPKKRLAGSREIRDVAPSAEVAPPDSRQHTGNVARTKTALLQVAEDLLAIVGGEEERY